MSKTPIKVNFPQKPDITLNSASNPGNQNLIILRNLSFVFFLNNLMGGVVLPGSNTVWPGRNRKA